MGHSDRTYVFHTHTCYHRNSADHPDFCMAPGRARRRVTSKMRRRDASRIIARSIAGE